MKRDILFICLLILLLRLALASTVAAQEVNPETISDDEVNAVAKQLYCPVCENIPLDVCGTKACEDWREEIRIKLAEGWSEDQIKDHFVDRFGDRVLAAPPARGLNWLVYIVPPVTFLAGAYILYQGIRSWRQGTADEFDQNLEQESDDPYIRRLEEELREQ